jgi:type III secretion protein T
MDVLTRLPIVLAVDTSDYASFLKSLPPFPMLSLLSLFLLSLMRIAPIVAIIPFLGSKLPGAAKAGFALVLVAILFPSILVSSPEPIAFDTKFIGIAFKELFMGFILAFLASIPFHIASSAGVLIDFLRGSSALQVGDPTFQMHSSPIGILYNQMLIVFFFQVNGPILFLDTVVQSYRFLPVHELIPSTFFNLQLPFWQLIMQLLTKVTAFSIQFSAPALLAILMAEMFLGIANRLATQVQIAFLGMALKSILGIALLWAGWSFILKQMTQESLSWLHEIVRVLSNF